jgi:hypothetical protein
MNEKQTMLILAVTRMRGGVCVAGMTDIPDPLTHFRWIRPVKLRSHLLPGDIRYDAGRRSTPDRLMAPGDVISWRLQPVQVEPPHVEDVLVDPVRDRPMLLRRHDAPRLARFCAEHLDTAPTDVLCDDARSLCLTQPDDISACWNYDPYNGHYEARLRFRVGSFATDERGVPVTDLAWRALGRLWLAGSERLELDDRALRERLGKLFLVIGRGRLFEGRRWLIVVGVHAAGLPDVVIDEAAL